MHKQIFKKEHGVYFLTKKGASHTALPPISDISLGSYKHQLTVTDVRQRLCAKYPDAKWISERELKHHKFYYGIGKTGHVSDGVLILSSERKIAIEIELSLKGKRRLKDIFSAYGGQLEIEEAWYFCAKKIMRPMSALAKNKPYIKIHSLEEFLYEKQL